MNYFFINAIETFSGEELEVSLEKEVIAYCSNLSEVMEIIELEAAKRNLTKEEYEVQHNY